MSVSPIFVQNKKSTARVLQTPTIGVDGEFPELNKYRYFRAAEAITAGQWVGLNMASSDLRSVALTNTATLLLTFSVGVATETVTTAEAGAGKMVKVQIAGFYPSASVATGGAAGWWVCMGATGGRGERIDPTALTPTAAEVRSLGDRMGILLETAGAGVASVWILPRFI